MSVNPVTAVPSHSRGILSSSAALDLSTRGHDTEYLAELAAEDSSAPRVPRVLHCFYQQGRMAYVVMDLIQLVQVSPEVLTKKAAQAVRWMCDVRVPDDVVLGPRAGVAPTTRSSRTMRRLGTIAASQLWSRYFNKVRLPRSR